ncbi:MAG: ABC transporter permease [Lentisphaerae bacterium RIFOXYB12_FULL_65_16]|nr:MAG: ABC transporter permease [Lentisphaerae bacterium RIFOXYA12_64_32]OGV87029.1 MAG: ABC transporter permease [Lentisphaerae bacterium RIFOXYB12_FULL_65_16]
MNLLLGAWTIGLIMALLAVGVFISFRVFGMADITVDGSITLGAAVAAVLLVRGINPVLATLCGFLAGMVAGTVTGVMCTRLRINPLLAGILTMTALYSVNLRIMGKSNVSLASARSLGSWCETWGERWFHGSQVPVAGYVAASRDVAMLAAMLIAVSFVSLLLYAFFKTQLGTAMRAAGDSPQMVRALGGSVENYQVIGLALSNGLVALSGALLAQYQGFSDAQMGIGMVVWGLASIIIGEALTGGHSLGLAIVGSIMGSVLFRLVVALVLRWGLNPNDLKLITAVFVLVALVLPRLLQRRKAAATA